MIVIVDIDGTLCTHEKREKIATDIHGVFHWDIFYTHDNVMSDEPIWETINNVKKYKDKQFKIIIFTARPEAVRSSTELWLHTHGIPFDALYMRSVENHTTPAIELKKKMYDTFIDDKVFCAFEDRDEIVDLWLSLGIPTFKIEYEQHKTA
jgi:hypothetical protein